jgi:5-methylcytosine-specific restriction endonuclease McrA
MDITKLPKTRAEAKATGAAHYFTGEPCKHGHIAPRKTKGACIECLRIEWVRSNEARAGYFRAYNQSESGQTAKERYYAKNKAAVIARAQARPPEEKRAYKQRYKEANPDLYNTLTSLRRRRFRDATPPWLSRKQKLEIRQLYQIAITMSRTTGEQYVVDHIMPIQGEDVCGLHVPWNLRVITQEENLAKSNKLVDTPPNP